MIEHWKPPTAPRHRAGWLAAVLVASVSPDVRAQEPEVDTAGATPQAPAPTEASDAWYDWGIHGNPENVKIVIPQTGDGGQARTLSAYFIGAPHEYRVVLPEEGSFHTNLKVMAHEWGHIMARYYDYNTRGGCPLEEQVDEGFGDQTMLRYAMFRHKTCNNEATEPVGFAWAVLR